MRTGSVLKKRAILCAAVIVLVFFAATLLTGCLLGALTGLPVWAAVFLGALAGAGCACGIGFPLVGRLVNSLSASLTSLRDAAVKIADGSGKVRASEHAAGEIGEVGRAINQLSLRLSRNMYQLILERNRLKYILNNLSEGILAVDLEGKITHRNPMVDALMTSSAHVSDVQLHRLDGGRVWDDLKRTIETGENIERTIHVCDKVIRISISPLIDEIGMTAGAVSVFADITQQERLERTRRDYVANISHEMRTPLTAVRALIEPLKEGMIQDESARMRYYDIILREVMRLTRLISDLMELSRLQSGSVAIEKVRMKLDDLLYDICDRYTSIAEEHGLSFDIKGDFSLLPEVTTNADRVEQMMVILLDNAIKYTERGGLTVGAEYDADKVTISVSDTGIGIDPEDLPHVFDRFYKVDKAHSGKGSGLGLSIAKELWQWMGETLTVESEKGRGTCFRFTVSRRAKQEEDEPSRKKQPKPDSEK